MLLLRAKFPRILSLVAFLLMAVVAYGAQGGNAGSIRGTVTDPSGAVIPGATVHLKNAVSGLDRTIASDATGQFEIDNVPFNNYQRHRFGSGLYRDESELRSSVLRRPDIEACHAGGGR